MNQHSPTMISKVAINKAKRPPGRRSRKPAQITPSTKIDRDNNARRLICSRVGGGAFERFGTRSMGDDVLRGAPQPMHTVALLLTARPHSLHAIRAMAILPNSAVSAAHNDHRIRPNGDHGPCTVECRCVTDASAHDYVKRVNKSPLAALNCKLSAQPPPMRERHGIRQCSSLLPSNVDKPGRQRPSEFSRRAVGAR